MIGFYAIRKLLDAKKLGPALTKHELEIKRFKAKRNVTRLNWHKIDEIYDLANPTSENVGLRYVCNQFVHSYVFSTVHNEAGGLDVLLFVSDYDRNKFLYGLAASDVADLFELVARDEKVSLRLVWDPNAKDFEDK